MSEAQQRTNTINIFSGNFTGNNLRVGNRFEANNQHFNNDIDDSVIREFLGDESGSNRDLFETGSASQRRTALLNILHYDGSGAKREQLAVIKPSAASFAWIEDTEFPKWLCTAATPPFWIKGKPGAGKSTLMKHLTNSISIRDRLSRSTPGKAWTIVHFFFDYRAGLSTANKMSGMLKLFLRQLSLDVPRVAERLELRKGMLNDENIETYIDSLAYAVRVSEVSICAFIDGLDEYEGDLCELCSVIEEIRIRAGMKLCLASRPELALEDMLASLDCQTITMQHHNYQAIEACIRHKVVQIEARNLSARGLITEPLQAAIVAKAQGIILWASLVLDEMIKTMLSSDVCVADSATSLLDSLPADIEALYERILAKIPKAHQSEAALLVHLTIEHEVATGGRPCPLDVLFEACNFLLVVREDAKRLATELSVPTCGTRLKGLLGNLIEVTDVAYIRWTVRLTHKSLATYMERSQWIQRHVAKPTLPAYTDSLWTYLPVAVIGQANQESAIPQEKLEPKLIVDILSRQQKPSSVQPILDPCFVSPLWQPWKALLRYCFAKFFLLTRHDRKIGFPAVASSYALLHLYTCHQCYHSECWVYHRAQAKTLWERGRLHFMLDFIHERWLSVEQYVREHANDTDPNIMQLLYDLTIRSTFGMDETPVSPDWSALLETWASHGYRLEGRHICMCLYMYFVSSKRRFRDNGLLGLKRKIAAIKPAEQLSTEHDEYCGLYGSGTPLAHHWLDQIVVEDAVPLDVLIAFGIDVEASVGSEDSIYHAILRCTRDKSHDIDSCLWARRTFAAAARAGMRPDVAKSERSALDYALKLRTKAQWRSIWKKTKTSQHYYHRFLDLSIKALEEYERDGEWGPGMEAFDSITRTGAVESPHPTWYQLAEPVGTP
ncbi:hypothetical protein LTR70_003467 [Exophiala xenobiotica]|uniref:Nephrocystin 3-like N-terminal domain-containing protein n=1 Tax=Lithohypha guttulata TaxID=1690604 RepID=A0ABR0KG37_9EURO|nr:hypothetical protein LTR24_003015 [Lithohypha guttulata]KAK5323005.1 hypothetical protein LTR70_003467 [Exophiala xenobiotica]